MLKPIGCSPAVSAITKDEKFIEQLVEFPEIERNHLGHSLTRCHQNQAARFALPKRLHPLDSSRLPLKFLHDLLQDITQLHTAALPSISEHAKAEREAVNELIWFDVDAMKNTHSTLLRRVRCNFRRNERRTFTAAVEFPLPGKAVHVKDRFLKLAQLPKKQWQRASTPRPRLI